MSQRIIYNGRERSLQFNIYLAIKCNARGLFKGGGALRLGMKIYIYIYIYIKRDSNDR